MVEINKETLTSIKTEELRNSIKTSVGNFPHVFRGSKKRQENDGCSAGVMSYLDSLGKGPKNRVKIGKKTAYPIDDYAEWFISRISPVQTKEVIHENQTTNS